MRKNKIYKLNPFMIFIQLTIFVVASNKTIIGLFSKVLFIISYQRTECLFKERRYQAGDYEIIIQSSQLM